MRSGSCGVGAAPGPGGGSVRAKVVSGGAAEGATRGSPDERVVMRAPVTPTTKTTIEAAVTPRRDGRQCGNAPALEGASDVAPLPGTVSSAPPRWASRNQATTLSSAATAGAMYAASTRWPPL